MRLLITGAAGFVGSNLIKQLQRQGHATVGVDDFSSASWTNLVDYAGDIMTMDVASDISPLVRGERFDVIFHQASITDTTVMDEQKMMHNNVEGFRNLLDLAVRWGTRVLWASSASIYGRSAAPNKETQRPDPLNVYAFSKLTMERLAESYRAKLSQPIIGLRYFNVYGPGEVHKGKFASMIHQLARQMRVGKRPRIFTDGQQKRDFVHVDDVVQANFKAMSCPSSGIFNVGSGAAFSFNEVVAELNRVLQTKLEPDYFENPYSFTQDHTEADLSHSRQVLGYEPQFPPARGIQAYAESGKLGV